MVNFVAHLIVFLSHGIFCLLTVLETWQIKFERTDELNSKPTSLFAAYNLNSLNGKLNGPSREENTPWFKWTQIDQSSRQRVNPKFTHICPYGSLWVFEARRPSHVCLPQLLIPFLGGEERNVSLYSCLFTPPPCDRGQVNPSFPICILQVCRTASKNVLLHSICYNFRLDPSRLKLTGQEKCRSCPISAT